MTVDHYLDDFVTMGLANSQEYEKNLCYELGGAAGSSCLTFLGIKIDIRAGVLRLLAVWRTGTRKSPVATGSP